MSREEQIVAPPADPAERDPHLREEAADKAGRMRYLLLARVVGTELATKKLTV